ncbi:NAD(P)-dependent oxidoreductase [Streptomyces fuscichromogenes]|uniref:6-phosphogluconate dehydrogenase n=1 Tax=Streptomyces fuscichromogenes TaxID=1324013 RepID=A0A917XKE3_9ACTN|nr:NAD(P)-dependent oxidoreductase [Streptomyces fuscichromogenes]GGN34083.1 6-phosphogluconate dehydrogenase [Streptomyces fuscichromogenes]
MRIGFIGPGRMGRPMLEHLTAAGHEATVLVRRPQARAAAEAAGLDWADTVAATVRDADVVFVVVLTDEQVRSVCLGPDGAIEAMKPAATLVQHTTSDPATARLLADAGVHRGIKVVDAALSGGPHDVVAGRLTLWVGADETALDEVRPLLETYASPILPVGPVGNGQRVKLVNNALFVAQLGLVVDAVRLADSLGLPEQTLLAAVRHGSGTSRALGVVAHGEGGVQALADRLGDLMRKDVTVVREVARNAGADLGIIGTVLSSDAVEKTVLDRARTVR